MSTNDYQKLRECPFCGGEANTLHKPHVIDMRYSVGCNDDECRGFIALSWLYKTEADAIAAWNKRAERTCKFVSSKGSDYPPVCTACGYELGIYDCEWFEDGTYGYGGNYCPNCGAKVIGG